MREIRTDNWAKGANNLAKPERLPEGFVRHLSNVDPMPDGQLELRAGYECVLQAADCRLGVALGERIVYVDGSDIGCYSISSDSAQVIGAISAAGEVAGVAYNGQVYLNTERESVRTDGVTVKSWAINSPGFAVERIAGSLAAGIYKVAVTALGDDDEESGCDPMIVRLAEGEALRVSSDDPRTLKAYVSAVNGASLFSQGPLIGGAMAITSVDDSRERLTTGGLMPMPFCSMLAAYNGIIVGVHGRYVLFSSPMHPHLFDPTSNFFQYSDEPSLIAATDGGLYVAAGEKTYFITQPDSGTPVQRPVFDIGAIKGSATQLPDGRAAWFTRYGLAIGGPDGVVALPNRQTYAPDLAAMGAAGVLEHNGGAMVVTTMRGVANPNNIGTGDFAYLET